MTHMDQPMFTVIANHVCYGAFLSYSSAERFMRAHFRPDEGAEIQLLFR
jgi:hypothetical protein